MALIHRAIQKIRQCNCHIVLIAPGGPGMPRFWDLVQLLMEIPLLLPASKTLLKQPHNQVFHHNPQYLNLHTWSLGVDSFKNKSSLWKWQRELLPLKGHQQGPFTSRSGPFLGGLHVTNPPIRFMCPTSVCLSTFSFPDSNSKMLCPIEFKLDREIDHHHS